MCEDLVATKSKVPGLGRHLGQSVLKQTFLTYTFSSEQFFERRAVQQLHRVDPKQLALFRVKARIC